MSKSYTPKIITANDLMAGKVIYLTDQDTWTTDRGLAEIFTTQTHAKSRLDLALTQPKIAVGPYVVDANYSPREFFRANGPFANTESRTNV